MRPIAPLLALAVLTFAGSAPPATAQVAPTDCATVNGEPQGDDPFVRDVWVANRASCELPPPDLSVAEALTVLDGEAVAVRREGDAVTVIVRSEEEEPTLCCSLQGPMRPIGSGLYVLRQRLERAEETALSIMPFGAKSMERLVEHQTFPVPKQAEPPERVDELAGRIVDSEIASGALGEVRLYSVYLPPGYDPRASLPLLVMADGASLPSMAPLVEAGIASGRVPPLVVLGVHSGPDAVPGVSFDYDVRGADYVPDAFPDHTDRFGEHLRFVTYELVPAVVSKYGLSTDRQDTIVAGWSNGGVFALNAGLREPETFGASIVMSSGSGRADLTVLTRPAPRARFYGSAGLHEPYSRVATRRAMRVLGEEGYDVAYTERPAGHDFAQWEVALMDGLERALAERREDAPPAG